MAELYTQDWHLTANPETTSSILGTTTAQPLRLFTKNVVPCPTVFDDVPISTKGYPAPNLTELILNRKD